MQWGELEGTVWEDATNTDMFSDVCSFFVSRGLNVFGTEVGHTGGRGGPPLQNMQVRGPIVAARALKHFAALARA
jgi:hypothetical protein